MDDLIIDALGDRTKRFEERFDQVVHVSWSSWPDKSDCMEIGCGHYLGIAIPDWRTVIDRLFDTIDDEYAAGRTGTLYWFVKPEIEMTNCDGHTHWGGYTRLCIR